MAKKRARRAKKSSRRKKASTKHAHKHPRSPKYKYKKGNQIPLPILEKRLARLARLVHSRGGSA